MSGVASMSGEPKLRIPDLDANRFKNKSGKDQINLQIPKNASELKKIVSALIISYEYVYIKGYSLLLNLCFLPTPAYLLLSVYVSFPDLGLLVLL